MEEKSSCDEDEFSGCNYNGEIDFNHTHPSISIDEIEIHSSISDLDEETSDIFEDENYLEGYKSSYQYWNSLIDYHKEANQIDFNSGKLVYFLHTIFMPLTRNFVI